MSAEKDRDGAALPVKGYVKRLERTIADLKLRIAAGEACETQPGRLDAGIYRVQEQLERCRKRPDSCTKI